MCARNGQGFRFGLETEYMLADAESFRPLWYRDLSFEQLNATLEAIDLDGLPPLDGLDLEPPHRKLMPFVVEGYHVPDPDFCPIDLLPKGVEIRTPVCDSIEECLVCLAVLHERLQSALAEIGYRAVSLSHHPTESHFAGPQNKRRHDFWQWAMEVMVTYGPDINVSLPAVPGTRLDAHDLETKVNYYGPAMAALSLASPLFQGGLWRIRGQIGKSIRTYRRSVIAPAIELHPEERGRLEFKLFEATDRLADYNAYFLLWLTLLLDDSLSGRASNSTRIYDLGAVARDGLAAETIAERVEQLLDHADVVLPTWGFDAHPLLTMRHRLETGQLPADEIIKRFECEESIEGILRQRSSLRLEESRLPEAIAKIA